jgi:hypothetical protein
MKYLLSLESKNSPTIPSTCNFVLNQPIINGSKLVVKSFTFANSLYNITSPNNTLVFNTPFTATIPQGYYTFSSYISTLNALLVGNATFLTNMSPATTAVSFNSSSNTVSWTIGSNSLTSSSLLWTFALAPGNYTGTFTSQIFLAAPSSICLHSPNIAPIMQNFCTNYTSPVSSPFYVGVINSSFGSMENTAESHREHQSVVLGDQSITSLSITLRDINFRELVECSGWALVCEVTTQ